MTSIKVAGRLHCNRSTPKSADCHSTSVTSLPRNRPASQLDQVEAHFSVVQSTLLSPDDFEDLDELAAQILVFEKHCNAAARPYDWKSPVPTPASSWPASGSTTGTYSSRWPHDTQRIDGRTRLRPLRNWPD